MRVGCAVRRCWVVLSACSARADVVADFEDVYVEESTFLCAGFLAGVDLPSPCGGSG